MTALAGIAEHDWRCGRADFLQASAAYCGIAATPSAALCFLTRRVGDFTSRMEAGTPAGAEATKAGPVFLEKELAMNKGDFVGGIPVQPMGGGQIMTLGGTSEDWICTWMENGQSVSRHFKPEDLEPAGDSFGET
jgi:hypothetical protein